MWYLVSLYLVLLCPSIRKSWGNEMTDLNNEEMKVLRTFKEIGKPAGPKTVSEESGIPKEDVSKIIKKLKNDGYVMSPKRCFYALDDKSKDVL